ncbi:MAG: PASTA domain-containing protein [Thermoleophilia bacterium]
MTRIDEPPAVVDGGVSHPVAALAPLPRPARAVAPFQALDLEVQPPLASGRLRARYRAVVTNRGAAPVLALLSVESEGGALRADVLAPAVALGPGERFSADVVLRPRRPQLLRGELRHSASLRVRGADAGQRATRQVVFMQARVLPIRVIALVVVLLAAAGVAASLMPDRVSVPTVTGARDAATAERALRGAGLQLDPRLRSRTAAGVRAGTILDQIPGPGSRAERGERVSLLVAVGARRSVVPALAGQSAARAAAVLDAARLSAGPVLPSGAAATSVVASQLPAAGARVPAGTAVTLVVRPAPRGETGAPAPAAPAADGAPPAVPEIDGRSVSDYAGAVVAAGLVPKIVRAVDPAPLGTLVGVRPPPGVPARPGEHVRLLVSAGVPQIAFDTGSLVRLFDPRTGRTVREASPPQGTAVEPSWSPDGRRVLYRVGRRLLLVSARSAEGGRVVYDGATKYAAATLAPAPADGVVALVRRTGADGDLCFGRLGAGRIAPRCSADPRWDLGRQISWRRGGRELLVFAVRRGRPGRFGILRYRSTRPFSTNPAHWRGTLVTDTSVEGRGVIGAQYSPSGESVALITNSGLPRFALLVTPAADLRDPAAPALPVRACEVAWRPDGRELAVVQSDDDCSRPVGQIVRVDPARPRQTVTISSGARHPAYQPLTYAGPKGVS